MIMPCQGGASGGSSGGSARGGVAASCVWKNSGGCKVLKAPAANPTLVTIGEEFQLSVVRLVWLCCTQCAKFMEEDLVLVCEQKHC